MLQTEEQRRWWFANHPEYSSRGTGRKVSPEAVDAYVDEHLQYVNGPVAALLKSVKRHFGTEGVSESGGPRVDPRFMFAQIQPPTNFGLRTNTMPTMDDLLRMPEKMVNEFLRWYNGLPERFPLLIDPNALEKHHGLSREFVKYFAELELDIEKYITILTAAKHRLKPDGVHTGEGRGGDWNSEWREFIRENKMPASPKDKAALQKKVLDKLEEMKERYVVR